MDVINTLQCLERKPHQPQLVFMQVELEFGDVSFCRGRKPENPEKTLGTRREPTTNSAHI